MSAALFPLFRPVAHEGKNYADGGLRNHFPIDELFAANPGKDTILGLNMVGVAPTFCSTMTSFETFFYVLYRTSVEIAMSDKTHELAKQCKYYMGHCNAASVMESKLWESFFTTPECRQNKRAEGTRLGLDFLQTKF
jgi:predicted acylesterase/phospholipase RssA